MDPKIVQWTAAFEIGVPEVDAQHRRLIEALGDFLEALRTGGTRERVSELLVFLASYVFEHFDCEEELMRKVGYPGLAAHQREHEGYRRRVRALIAHVRSAEAVLTLPLAAFVSEWIQDHILGSDRQIAAWLRRSAAA